MLWFCEIWTAVVGYASVFIYQRVKRQNAAVESWGICTCEDRYRADDEELDWKN